MPIPSSIIPVLEGMVGFQIGSADGGSIQGSQPVADWVELVKAVLGLSTFRYNTDYQFVLSTDVDSDGEVVDAGATDLIAGLGEMITTVATDAAGWWVYADVDSDTFAGQSALDNDIVALVHVIDVTTTGVSEFYPAIWLSGAGGGAGTNAYGQTGIRLNTGLTTSFDGVDGNDPAASAFRVWTLFRD